MLYLNTTKRLLAKYLGRGLAVTDQSGREVAVILPDADGWFHHAHDVVEQIAST